MLVLQVLILFQPLTLIKSSRVVDHNNQNGINMSDYCPKIGDCEEGTHVMCLYYNPERLMGPMCHDSVHISITPNYAETILNVINRVRSKVARGTAKGKGGVSLPRGYGIYRLDWDEELATFAQLWANQCMMKKDLCHATKKFPASAQMLGTARYTVDDWKPINSPGLSNSSTLTPDKVKYAIMSVLEAWYNYKNTLTAETVQKYENRISQFPYLIYGHVTHIGCGISAYREYMYKVNDDSGNLIYNSILVVCNYSRRVTRGLSVYTTDPPTMPGYTVRCGCPLGFDEDEDCLCYESGRQLPYSCRDNTNQCRPAVVVLPIFNVEDAPPQNVGNNATFLMDSTNEIFDRYDMLHEKKMPNVYSSMLNNVQNFKQTTRKSTRNYPLDVKSRYFGRIPKFRNNVNQRLPASAHFKKTSKLSIFSKPAIFELPFRRKNNNIHHISKYKKDVAPRKDFSKAQKLVSKYLKTKKISLFDVDENSTKMAIEVINITNYTTEKTTYNNVSVTTSQSTTDDQKLNSESDKKLMILLDNLEAEVKNIEINKYDKEIFDNKIRKIYGSLVGKSFLDNIDRVSEKMSSLKSKSETHKEIMDDIDLNKFNHDYHDERLNDQVSVKKDNIYSYNDEKIGMFDHKRKFYENNRTFKRDDMRNNQYLNDENDNFPLDFDRRRFYQNKLVNLQRKLEFMKTNGYRNNVPEDRKMRAVRPAKVNEELTYRKPKQIENTFYMPDRARFLHGF